MIIIKTKSLRVLPDLINAIHYEAPNLASVYIVGAFNPIHLPVDEAEYVEAKWLMWLELELVEETEDDDEEEEEQQAPRRRRFLQ